MRTLQDMAFAGPHTGVRGVSMSAEPFRMYIDGKWVDAESGATYELPNPATEETVGACPDAGRADMRRAIAAARRAFDEGPWPRTTPRERAAVLERLADGMERRKEEFRQLLVAAHAAEFMTHPIQLDTAIEQIRGYAELATRFCYEEMLPPTTATTAVGPKLVTSMAYRQPVGVCALIPTWNFPLYVTVQKIGPALATGCTMVTKPSPWGPLVDLLLAEVIEECDLPAGVYNVVSGQSPELGIELCESPLVDKVSFTGSVETGKRVMASAAATLKRVHLELGGKSAQIILDDFDLDAAAPGAASPTFFHAGQGCAITTRVLVQRSRHDELVEKMASFVSGFVKPGDPADPSVMLGPVIREERRVAIEAYVASGREEGADLVTGGGRPADLPRGYFLEPTIFANVRNDMRIAREEIFGPVVSVIPFDDEDDAVRIANDSSYGLYGGISTNDAARGLELAKRIRTGGVSVNGATNLLHAPFGGFKESGIGREGGLYGMREFTEIQMLAWPA
jgi:acyl-CoA reductase-like NAD-dependent aldehyde dehydrogenase